ncbi:MAG: hypothetical protein MUC99_08955 [Anaerolineae bacterium]|nr:hypothetical protein [Anaerolineae bacterium]
MSTTGLLVSALMLAVVVLFVFGPVLRRSEKATIRLDESAYRRERDAMKLAYQAVLKTLHDLLKTLHDLEEDYATGKLSEADYQAERMRWKGEGVRLIKALDEQKKAHQSHAL